MEAVLQGFRDYPGLEVHVVTCTQQPMAAPEKLADNIYFHSLHVPKLGWMRTLYQGCIRATRRRLREIQPDIVHGQGTERDCSISAVLSGFPSVVTIHGNMRVMAQLQQARPLSFYWLAARGWKVSRCRVRKVLSASLSTRNRWLRDSTRAPGSCRTLSMMHSSRSIPWLKCRPSSWWSGRSILERIRTHSFAPWTPSPRKKVSGGVFGGARDGDPYSDEFLKLVRMRSWCEFAGFADRATLKSWFARATALVLPSHEDNCPMVVLEAMASGIAVAASRVGGVPELIRDGDERPYVRSGSSGGNAIRRSSQLLDDHRKALAARAKEEAIRRFQPRVIAEHHIEIYHEVLAGGLKR